jgi:hypothetical protein
MVTLFICVHPSVAIRALTLVDDSQRASPDSGCMVESTPKRGEAGRWNKLDGVQTREGQATQAVGRAALVLLVGSLGVLKPAEGLESAAPSTPFKQLRARLIRHAQGISQSL